MPPEYFDDMGNTYEKILEGIAGRKRRQYATSIALFDQSVKSIGKSMLCKLKVGLK